MLVEVVAESLHGFCGCMCAGDLLEEFPQVGEFHGSVGTCGCTVNICRQCWGSPACVDAGLCTVVNCLRFFLLSLKMVVDILG